MYKKRLHLRWMATLYFVLGTWLTMYGQTGLYSIETGYTISNVRFANNINGTYIVANSYEGTVMGIGYDSTILWTHPLSGYMNHDIWCEDITGDGLDEILAANADGSIYCLSSDGSLNWHVSLGETPVFSTCVITHNSTKYVVAGGFDLSMYYISATGSIVKEIPSATYSQETTWGTNAPPNNLHLTNFIRKIKNANGNEELVVHGCVNTNSTNGSLYFFKSFDNLPYKIINPANQKPIGEIRISDFFGDGKEKIFMGSSTSRNQTDLSVYDYQTNQVDYTDISTIINQLGGFGYRVVQTEVIPKGSTYEYFSLIGNYIALIPPDLNLANSERLGCKYSFNDMWLDRQSQRILLASSQSGGSCIHVIDYTDSGWKTAYQNLSPPGKIQDILDNTQAVRNNLATFSAPGWERKPKPVYFVSDLSANGNSAYIDNLANDIHTQYDSPILLGTLSLPNVQDPADWKRDTMSNVFYRNTRDGRKNYVFTQNQVLNEIVPNYNNFVGLSYWGGHGNDPFFYSLKTKKALLDGANGKKTVLIYPELEREGPDFQYMMDKLMYPLATYAQTRNTQVHLRTKHVFWQGAAYGSNWNRMLSGEFANVFVPTMEETGDKSMDLSVAGRMGYWMSGAVNEWGTRAVPDNASFIRLRQHSHQKLPNHHLRQVIYSIASGATHLNNFRVDIEYTSLVWELIAKGALYVPERDELLSISPVHLSMTSHPDPYYLNEGSNAKWLTFYDEMREQNNKLVFSRLNATWPGAPVTDWDFSRYAANEKERRLNFIPSYNNGMVLITPVQNGTFAEPNQPRGKLVDHLHPMYKNIMKEFITDGRNYYAADSSQVYASDTYYKTIKTQIENLASELPLTVTGDVGWVVAQTDNMHLRLTIVDGGWINPGDKNVTVIFRNSSPISMVDLLDDKIFSLNNIGGVEVDIPCGGFRFIDITLDHPLAISKSNDPSVQFSISPNPVTQHVSVIFKAIDYESHFQVLDMMGRVLNQKSIHTLKGQKAEIQFELNNLPAGTYLMHWVGENSVKRFVKSR